MITWTDSARAELEDHHQRMRQALVASGADPDEVAADLQRHIEEELNAAKIHVATRADVQRVLGRMGVNGVEPSAPPAKLRAERGIAAAFALTLVLMGVGGYFYLRPVHHDALVYPPQWMVPTSQDPAGLVNPIAIIAHNPEGAEFQSGDSIVVTSVRGDRRDFEAGGRYLIEGDYTLASMATARLSVSVTANRGGIGGISPSHPEEGTQVHRGIGLFRPNRDHAVSRTFPRLVQPDGRWRVQGQGLL